MPKILGPDGDVQQFLLGVGGMGRCVTGFSWESKATVVLTMVVRVASQPEKPRGRGVKRLFPCFPPCFQSSDRPGCKGLTQGNQDTVFRRL